MSGGDHQRASPADFGDVFVAIGRVGCEAHFHASRATVTRWLEEIGKDVLIAKRSVHVADEEAREQQRRDFLEALARLGTIRAAAKAVGVTRRTVLNWSKRDPTFDLLVRKSKRATHRKGIAVHPLIVRRAAHFLRCVANGGYRVSPAPNGEWWIGTSRRSPEDLVAMAIRRGFDANLTASLSDGIGSGK